MKTFDILVKENEYKAIKKGWSWMGAIFGAFWALFNQMWAIGFGVLSFSILFSILPEYLGIHIGNASLGLPLFIIFGINGNKWKNKHLIGNGFELKDTIESENEESAILNYKRKIGVIE